MRGGGGERSSSRMLSAVSVAAPINAMVSSPEGAWAAMVVKKQLRTRNHRPQPTTAAPASHHGGRGGRDRRRSTRQHYLFDDHRAGRRPLDGHLSVSGLFDSHLSAGNGRDVA